MTPQQLEDAAKNRYNAVGDPHYPSDMMRSLIYQASLELATECLVIEDTFQTTSTAGTREYAYPTNAISIRRVEYNGKKIQPAPLESDPKTTTTSPQGTPGEYATWENTLILFPAPSVTAHVIKVFAYCEPQEVTTSSTTLDVPSRYHSHMIYFLLQGMAEKDNNPTMAAYYNNKWEKAKLDISRQQKKLKRGDQLAVVRDDCDNTGRNL